MTRAIQNFVNGAPVDAADGRTTDVVNPATGQTYATAPLSGSADVDAAMAAAAAAFEVWRDTTPSERSLALYRIADAIEARGAELVKLESENTGKPVALTESEEMPPMVDQIRFFAGAARILEGRGAGEYMKGLTSIIRREPVGVVAQVAPWNYPMMMAVWKFAPAHRGRQHRGAQAVGHHAGDHGRCWPRSPSEFLPPGVFNVICGDRDTGRGHGRPRHAVDGVDHRVGAGRHGGGEGRRPTR